MINLTGIRPLRYCEVIEGKGGYSLNLIKIVFPYDLKDIGLVKSLLNRRYVPDQRCWTAPLTPDNILNLQQWGFYLSPELTAFLEQSKPENQVSLENIKPIEIPGLHGTLLPFQSVGVNFIERKHGRALVADEMGLGKTIQALAWLQLHPELRPAVIIVPASLKLNWMQELRKWMPDPKCEILSGTTPYRTYGDILIINYDIL